MLQDGVDHKTPSVDELMAAIPEFDQDTNIATRIAGEMVLQVRQFVVFMFGRIATVYSVERKRVDFLVRVVHVVCFPWPSNTNINGFYRLGGKGICFLLVRRCFSFLLLSLCTFCFTRLSRL